MFWWLVLGACLCPSSSWKVARTATTSFEYNVYDSWDNNLEDCKEVCSFPSNLHLDDVEKNLNRQILTAQHFSWLHENSDIVDDDQCLILNGVYQNEGRWYQVNSAHEMLCPMKDEEGKAEPGDVCKFCDGGYFTSKKKHHKSHACICSRKGSENNQDFVTSKCPIGKGGMECNGKGFCTSDGKCACFKGYSGVACQIKDLDSHEQELVYIGGCKVYDEKFKLEDNITCRIQAKLPVSIKNFVAGYAFGTAWICGGELCDGDGSPLNICYKFNKYDQVWEEEDGMNLPRKLAASAAIRTPRDDRMWLVSFGESSGLEVTATMDQKPWYDKNGWRETAEIPPLPPNNNMDARQGHCMIQINSFEVAILGGFQADDTSELDKVLIYNFEKKTWRYGPELTMKRYNVACGTTYHPKSGHKHVVSACGFDVETGTASNLVETWDLLTNEVYILDGIVCPDGVEYFDSGHNLDTKHPLFTNGQGVWTFTIEEGFSQVADWQDGSGSDGGSGILTNQGLFWCED